MICYIPCVLCTQRIKNGATIHPTPSHFLTTQSPSNLLPPPCPPQWECQGWGSGWGEQLSYGSLHVLTWEDRKTSKIQEAPPAAHNLTGMRGEGGGSGGMGVERELLRGGWGEDVQTDHHKERGRTWGWQDLSTVKTDSGAHTCYLLHHSHSDHCHFLDEETKSQN